MVQERGSITCNSESCIYFISCFLLRTLVPFPIRLLLYFGYPWPTIRPTHFVSASFIAVSYNTASVYSALMLLYFTLFRHVVTSLSGSSTCGGAEVLSAHPAPDLSLDPYFILPTNNTAGF